MAEATTKDYVNSALDEYIRDHPNALKKLKLKSKPFPRKIPSQQWRLGRNGPRPLKRLMRQGPLRPFSERSFDGLPRLVAKRYFSLPRRSVFLRLGWNPVYMARNRVRRARHHLWNRQYFNQRQVNPMGGRPSYYNWQRPYWQQHRWGRPNWQRRPMQRYHNFQSSEMTNQQLIKAERLRIQKLMLQKVQNSYQQELPLHRHNQASTNNPFHAESFRQQGPTLPDGSTASMYPIARDEYMPANNSQRPASPEGSIISALCRTSAYNTVNPFARPPSQSGSPFAKQPNQPVENPFTRSTGQFNPFALPMFQVNTRSNSAAYQQAQNLSTNTFRPTVSTTAIPCNRRFTNQQLSSNMY